MTTIDTTPADQPPVADAAVMPPDGAPGATRDAQSLAAIGLLIVGGLLALHLGRVILMPLATALLLSLVLRPILRRLDAWHVPHPVSAFALVLAITAAVVTAVYGLKDPASQWLREAPSSLRQLEYRMGDVKESIAEVREATKQVEELSQVGDTPPPVVVVEEQDLPSQIFIELRQAAMGVFMALLMLFFILGWGRQFYRNLVLAQPKFASRRAVVAIADDIQHFVATYLATITLINIGLGAVVAAVLYLLGMPNPILWGVLAAMLNYIPYLGPTVMALVLAFVALMTYPTLGEALLIPAVFLAITSLEGYIITPLAVGSRLSLNPLVIFVSLVFWFWMWGIIGGLLTVPLLVCIKVVVKHVADERVARILE